MIYRRIVSLQERLVHLLQFGRRLAQRKLVVVQAALNIKVCFHEIQIALAFATDNGLVVNVKAITDGFQGIGDIGAPLSEIKAVGAP
jgi:hypothetical protein